MNPAPPTHAVGKIINYQEQTALSLAIVETRLSFVWSSPIVLSLSYHCFYSHDTIAQDGGSYQCSH